MLFGPWSVYRGTLDVSAQELGKFPFQVEKHVTMAVSDAPYSARKPEGDQSGGLVSAIPRRENLPKTSMGHSGTPA